MSNGTPTGRGYMKQGRDKKAHWRRRCINSFDKHITKKRRDRNVTMISCCDPEFPPNNNLLDAKMLIEKGYNKDRLTLINNNQGQVDAMRAQGFNAIRCDAEDYCFSLSRNSCVDALWLDFCGPVTDRKTQGVANIISGEHMTPGESVVCANFMRGREPESIYKLALWLAGERDINTADLHRSDLFLWNLVSYTLAIIARVYDEPLPQSDDEWMECYRQMAFDSCRFGYKTQSNLNFDTVSFCPPKVGLPCAMKPNSNKQKRVEKLIAASKAVRTARLNRN